MTIYSIIALAVALAMDAFAVSIATGAYLKSLHIRQVFRLSWHFGLFQAMMEVELVNDGPVTVLLDPRPGRSA